jgi:long-subunit acyl-CoA synthetase (AMP-forming)
MACLTAGVVPVTLPASSSADQLSAILRHSEARYVFVDDDHQLRKLSSKQTLDQLDAIFRLERSTASPNDHKDASDENDNEEESRQLQQSKIISWRDFLRRGARVTQAVLEQQMQQPQSDQLASIVYASGFDHTTCVYLAPLRTVGCTRIAVCPSASLNVLVLWCDLQ